jgi:hypothetical protein
MPGGRGAPTLLEEKTVYANDVSNKTGLTLATVYAWMHAENGPGFNYLGIRDGAGFASYATPQDAAAATVRVLNQPNMAPILLAAKQTDNPKVQLAAIAQSPWDTGRVGPKPAYLQLLLGSLAAVTAKPQNAAAAAAPGTNTDPGQGVDFGGMFGGLEKWLQQESALALSYLVLVILGLVFVIYGALDTFGYSPARVAASAKPPVPDPIPF